MHKEETFVEDTLCTDGRPMQRDARHREEAPCRVDPSRKAPGYREEVPFSRGPIQRFPLHREETPCRGGSLNREIPKLCVDLWAPTPWRTSHTIFGLQLHGKSYICGLQTPGPPKLK